MKFRFCGDLDCPDWVLAEIATISKISNIRVRVLVGQIITGILGGNIDYAKILKLTADSNFEISDVKGSVAALHFIISNSAKHDVDEPTLVNELQQLGLPKEHSESVCKPYRENKDKLRKEYFEETLKLPRLESVDWRVDYLIGSNSFRDLRVPSVQLKLNLSLTGNKSKTADDQESNTIKKKINQEHAFEIDADKFRVLFNELKTARTLMDVNF